jgi:hypothetical protein
MGTTRSTEGADMGLDGTFRKMVREYAEMGYGRMVQIVDEEWRRAHPVFGGVLCLCRKCDTLLDQATGEPTRQVAPIQWRAKWPKPTPGLTNYWRG